MYYTILLPVSLTVLCTVDAIAHALSSAAVLQRVFSFLPRDSNYRNSLVCKRWRGYASLAVWRVVSAGIFRSLASSEVESTGHIVSETLDSVA